MSDPEKKICRYFNTLGGCWYGDGCKFLHIPNKKPPCKFYGSSTGCRYGESCHFSHDRTPFKSVENYNNPPSELMKEVFKENMDPSELSGTNNNNMTQSVSVLGSPGQQTTTNSVDNGSGERVNYSNNQGTNNIVNNDSEVVQLVAVTTDTNTNIDSNEDQISNSTNLTGTVENLCTKPPTTIPICLENVQPKSTVTTQELTLGELSNNCMPRNDENQKYAITTISGRSNGVTNEIEIFCGSCKRILERKGNESYCTLLKDHYLECFLDKEGDHVKYVKTKAALEPGQMYWCKSCILIFEKPWSLFQHMADKAKGSKVQRWEKKIHLDWMDSVAGLMAGYDLGLFSPAKLRVDLRNLLADQHTMEEEMEAAAVTAAAMMQWLAPLSSPWRLQQREMMRKIEQLNRQMLRKANMGLSGPPGGYNTRAAIAAASANSSQYNTYNSTNRNTAVSLPAIPSSRSLDNVSITCALPTNQCDHESPVRNVSSPLLRQQPNVLLNELNSNELEGSKNEPQMENMGPVGDGDSTTPEPLNVEQPSLDILNATGASGDAPMKSLPNNTKSTDCESDVQNPNLQISDFNNTNSVFSSMTTARGDDGGRRNETKRTNFNYLPSYTSGISAAKLSNTPGALSSKSSNESARYQFRGRNSRALGYGHSNFATGHRNTHRTNRGGSSINGPPNRGANVFNPPSFHASLDLNFGFTNDEVEELLSQGIKPWDSEAAAALAVLRGELDHLLD